MSYLHVGEKGVPLRHIIKKLGNKDYKYIECRCKYLSADGQEQDDFFGACSYINGELKALDGDSYSLDDLYIEWEEYTKDENTCLTLWEYGYLSNE